MLSTIWNTIIYRPILNALLILYAFFGDNLGIAIITLTIAIRLIIFPLMKKQLESSNKIQQIQPKIKELQKKYKDDPQKLQQKQLQLYKKVGYDPLGCFLSAIIPYPFLIAIYQSIRAFSQDEAIQGIYDFVSNFLNISGELQINQKFLFWDLSKSYLPLGKEHGYLELWVLVYLFLALLVGVSQFVSVKISSNRRKTLQAKKEAKNGEKNKSKKKKKGGKKKDDKAKEDSGDVQELSMENMATDMGKSMMFTMPMMTTFIALSAPAAVSLYWIVQSWMLVGLQVVYYKFIKKE